MADDAGVDTSSLVSNIQGQAGCDVPPVPEGRKLIYFPEFRERMARVQDLDDYERFMAWFDAEYAVWVRRVCRARRAKKIIRGQGGRLSGPLAADRREGFWQCAGLASTLYTRGQLRHKGFARQIVPQVEA